MYKKIEEGTRIGTRINKKRELHFCNSLRGEDGIRTHDLLTASQAL